MAATVVAGIALANPASAAVNPATVGITPSTATVYTGVAATYNITSGPANAAGNAVVAEVSIPTSSAAASPLTVTSPEGTAGAATTVGSNYVVDIPLTTDASGNATVNVSSSAAGTVSIIVGAGTTTPSTNPRASASLIVKGHNAGGAVFDVTKLAASPANVALYNTDTSEDFTVTATDSSGVAVPGAQVYYQIKNGIVTTPAATFGASTTGSDGSITGTIAASALKPGSTVTFWVNNSTAAGTSATDLDASDTQTTSTVTFSNAPSVDQTSTSASVTSPDSQIEAGKAASVPFTLTLTNGGSPVSGAHVAIDVALGAATPVRYNGTTGANGTFTATADFTAAQAVVANSPITAVGYLSGSSTEGQGTQVSKAASVAIAAGTFTISAPTDQSAAVGSTITIPVTIKDQFGNTDATIKTMTYSVAGRNTIATTTVPVTNGTATVTYTDKGTSGALDTVTLNATGTTAGALTATTKVHYVTSVTPADVTFTGPTLPGVDTSEQVSDLNADTYPVIVHVVNSNNEALAGTPVTASVNIGFIGDSTVTGETGTATANGTTDASGNVTFYVGSEQTGVQSVTATAGAVKKTDATTVTYTNSAFVKVTITGPSKAIAPGGTGTFVAKAQDTFGNGIPGELISFSASDPSVLPGAVSPVTVTAGPNGTASITITVPADSKSAGGTITASAPYEPAPNNVASAAYTVAAPTAAKVTVATSSPLRALSVEGVYATLTDSTGARLKGGVVVQFTVTGAAHVTTSAKTNLYGVAKAYFRPSRAGSMTVTATSGGVSGSTTVTVLRAIEQPSLTAVSNSRGLAHVVVITDPKLPLVRVTIYKAQNHGYISAGTFKAGTGGRVHVNLRVRSGATVHFKARANNLHYIERYSNVDTVKVQ